MPSLEALSVLSASQGPSISAVPASATTIAQARTADPIVFLEITAREAPQSITESIVPGRPGLTPVSALPISSLDFKRTKRQAQTFLYSTRPWIGRPTDTSRPNISSNPRLITAGRISRSAPVDITSTRRAERTLGSARLANPDGALDFLLKDFTLQGESIRAYLAAPGDDANEWLLVYESIIDSIDATRREVRVDISTIADELSRPLQVSRYSGSGDIAGDANVVGRLKPIAYGQIYGADPVLINSADNVYAVNDGPIESIDWVREGGLDFAFTQDYPTYDSLRAATLGSGEYATCLGLGIFRIGVGLAGLAFPLRVGLQGDASGEGYVSSTGEVLYRIALNRAFYSTAQVDLESFQALPGSPIGYYYSGASDLTVDDVFSALLRGVNASYGVSRSSKLTAQRLSLPESRLADLTVGQDQIIDTRVDRQPVTLRVFQPYSYAPTFAPLSANDISPGASPEIAGRLSASAQEGEVVVSGSSSNSVERVSTLPTFFAEESAAIEQATRALEFTAVQRTPLRVDLQRLGLLVDINRVIEVVNGRFDSEFRGVVYEQEDSLGVNVTSRVVAYG